MALRGIKVVELAGLAPGPFCGMILADYGATVTRVARLNETTDLDPLCHGKRSLALNLKHPRGVALLKKLCRQSDVLIEPFRPGVMEAMGLGPDVLLSENPRLVYARLSGYGAAGQLAKKAGHDINYLALSGLLSLFGRHQEKPLAPCNLAADFAGGGLVCAMGIAMALLERTNSNCGQVLDADLLSGTAYVGSWLFRSQSLPMLWGQERGQNMLDSGAHFYDTYETKDGKYVSVGAIEPQFYQELVDGLGLSAEEVPQFGDDAEQQRQAFAAAFKTKTRDEWVEHFKDRDACFAPVLSLEEAAEHPHNKANRIFSKNKDVYVPQPAPKLSRTPARSLASHKKPSNGENTLEILNELGCSQREISELGTEGVVLNCSKAKL